MAGDSSKQTERIPRTTATFHASLRYPALQVGCSDAKRYQAAHVAATFKPRDHDGGALRVRERVGGKILNVFSLEPRHPHFANFGWKEELLLRTTPRPPIKKQLFLSAS